MSILEDDRMLRRVWEIEKLLQQRRAEVGRLSDGLWEVFEGMVGDEAVACGMRSTVAAGLATAAAYWDRVVVQPYRCRPLSFVATRA